MRSSKRIFAPDPLAPKPLHHMPIRTGMVYAMAYGGRIQEAPNTVMPVARQSLAQRVLIHRYQLSKYISPLTRIMSPVPLIGYPTAKTQMIIRSAPTPNQTPIMSKLGPTQATVRTARGGTQAPLPRFKKALPTRPPTFNPPVYGG